MSSLEVGTTSPGLCWTSSLSGALHRDVPPVVRRAGEIELALAALETVPEQDDAADLRIAQLRAEIEAGTYDFGVEEMARALLDGRGL